MRSPRPRWLRVFRVRTRRIVARIERFAPALALLITPYGMSVAFHGLMVLLFALYVYSFGRLGGGEGDGPGDLRATFADQLTDDLTSLADGDRAGDPFTSLDTEEPPSLSFEPPAPDETRINVPMLPADMRLGPDLQLTPTVRPPDIGRLSPEGVKSLAANIGSLTAPFSGRQGAVRARLIRRGGGSVESEKAVELGLDWIARHQRPDGGWSTDIRRQCSGGGCPGDETLESDTAATGLALLPMLGAGLSHTDPSRYRDVIKRGLSWLIRHQSADGDLFVGGGRNTHLYSHAIGAMALCEAYGLTKDRRLHDPAQRAIHYIVHAQNPADGGWRYRPMDQGDTSVLGWQVFALRSALMAKLDVPERTVRGCRQYLDLAAADEVGSTYAYMVGRGPSPVMSAEGLLSRQILGWGPDEPPLRRGVAKVAADLESSSERNIYYWYYATQLLHNLGGERWDRWNVRVRDGLVESQMVGKGCDRGSWDPLSPEPDRWARSAGRLYLTSLSLLTLEVYYRYLPLYKENDGPFQGTPEPPAAVAGRDAPAVVQPVDPDPLR